ncbi:unnamed protein product [Lota lota]
MYVALAVCLSAVLLEPAAAGGVYCARTARARAAALGLDFPGVHEVPGLDYTSQYGVKGRPTGLYLHDDRRSEFTPPASSLNYDPIRSHAGHFEQVEYATPELTGSSTDDLAESGFKVQDRRRSDAFVSRGGELAQCVEVQTSSRVVPLGSEVTASCVVRPDCPLLGGGITNIELHLNQRLLARSSLPVTHGNWSVTDSNIRNVTAVVNFNQSSAFLTCCVQTSPCQVVGGVKVRAGFAPVAPGSLGCLTNLTTPSTMTCSWEPGPQDPLLPTNYTLYTRLSESGGRHSYLAPAGVQRVVLPRKDFILYEEMMVWVTASNDLGEATSDHITVEPLRSTRLDAPRVEFVQAGAGRYGCLQLKWSLSAGQHFISLSKMTLEARVRASQTPTWTLATVSPVALVQYKPVEVCDLLHGTRYQVQIRACYQGSPWSSWSLPQTGITLEKAPVGRLDYWMKVQEDEKDKHPAYHTVHLFWKPSSGFRSNGRVSSYRVTMVDGGRQVCSTAGSSCDLYLPRRVRRVFLWALNSAGKSSPTKVPLLPLQARSAISNITVVSQGERSLLVQWKTSAGLGHIGSGLNDFVVEWRPLLKTNSSLLLFELANRNQSSLLLTGCFEPYQPYQVSVYPRFRDAIGLPKTAMAYSRQKAPSSAPDLKVRSMWQPYVELTWDELPLQERNGIIRSYQLSYWDDPKHINVVTCDAGNPRVLLKGLSMLTSYSFLLTVSTDGGNRNGSVITFRTSAEEMVRIHLAAQGFTGKEGSLRLVLTRCVLCRVKVKLCPMIPDPAHSSIKSWSFDTLQELSWVWEDEPPAVHLSHLSLMGMSEKVIQRWSSQEDTSDLGDSICSSPLTPTFPETPCGSVSYATVICSCPYAGQRANQAPAYLRSESTQPLLESENYQNMAPDDEVIAREPFFFGGADGSGEGAGSDAGWEEFPMLRALALGDAPE